MGMFPEGGKPLLNPVGVAPGMFLEGSPRIISLPGVPSEMKAIVKESLEWFWKEFFKGVFFVRRNIIIGGIPEAELSRFVRRAQEKDPEIYIKSRIKVMGKPKKWFARVPPEKLPWMILLHFSILTGSREEGKKRIERAIKFLVNDLRRRYPRPLYIDLDMKE